MKLFIENIQRSFARSFTIADDVKVNGAELKDGLLTISCEKIIPEAKKRLIEIKQLFAGYYPQVLKTTLYFIPNRFVVLINFKLSLKNDFKFFLYNIETISIIILEINLIWFSHSSFKYSQIFLKFAKSFLLCGLFIYFIRNRLTAND